MKVAVLDDDSTQVDAVTHVVTAAGGRCSGFSRASALVSALRKDTFDLLVIDWNLPDRPGLEVIRWACTHLDPVPAILLITSRAEDADIVAGLNAGADDYLVKPFSPAVFEARLHALLRRSGASRKDRRAESFGDFRFDPAGHDVTLKGRPLDLTEKEFELALMLFRNKHRPLSRTYLLEAIWGGEPDLNSRTLDVHVSRVRSKLGLKPENGFRLAPVYGYGYRLETLAGSVMTDEGGHI